MQSFNLVDEKWIPITGKGLVSLREVFTDTSLLSLGGNPIQKISLIKFLLAIIHAACTPKDDEEWESLEGSMPGLCLKYLEGHKDDFWLYHDTKPFLQMPGVIQAKELEVGALFPEYAMGNTSILFQSQKDYLHTDSEKALLLLTLSNFALSGKKVDNNIVLTKGYLKKPSGKSGPSIGFLGYLHSFYMGDTLLKTLWLNTLTEEDINNLPFSQKKGTPVWEQMPVGEDCPRAIELKETYIGRLVPICRFMLLSEKGVHYSEGIQYPNHKDGISDISTTVDQSKEPKALWADPQKKPWRLLSSMLSFLSTIASKGFSCMILKLCHRRVTRKSTIIGIWSGGLRVSSNAGEQYTTGLDDYVESYTELEAACLNESWYKSFVEEMNFLDAISKKLRSAIFVYHKALKADKGLMEGACNYADKVFWERAEKDFQSIIEICLSAQYETEAIKLHKHICDLIEKIYDEACPHSSARQIEIWAKCSPNLKDFNKKGGMHE